MKYLLSIDGATHITGYALFDIKNNKLIDYGTICSSNVSIRNRVIEMIDGINDIISKSNK